MKELGSDFHWLDSFVGIPSDIEKLNPVEFADGRMAIVWLILNNRWKRLWVPAYFCYEVVDTIRKTGIELVFYPDYPEADDHLLVENIPFKKGDALLRINYFGLRTRRDESEIRATVIEDHSHGLLTDWAQHSNADYCIASLRKTLPLPEGGILWSPKGDTLLRPDASSCENDNLVYKRFAAMSLKAAYINGNVLDKQLFRQLYAETEEKFECLPVSAMSVFNKQLYSFFDYRRFNDKKSKNWHCLTSLLDKEVNYLVPESCNDTPFSLILKFEDEAKRNAVKEKLIKKNIYPAVLWPIPAGYKTNKEAYLSIHCDGRYSSADMEILATAVNNAYRNE